jgi:putative ABC transport system permease protein
LRFTFHLSLLTFHRAVFPLRHTIRILLKSPGFTVTAVLILGLGIGANTAVFSLIDGVLLKPLPYPHSNKLVKVELCAPNSGRTNFDYADFLDLKAAERSFDALCVSDGGDLLDWREGDYSTRVNVDFASPGIFRATGRPFILGRPFTDSEDIPNGPMLLVLSERFWHQHLNSDPAIIGKSIILSGQSFQIIGVSPSQIDDWGPPPADAYAPVNNLVSTLSVNLWDRSSHWIDCFGRLKDGIDVAQAEGDLGRIYAQLAQRYPQTDQGYVLRVIPLLDAMTGNYNSTIWLLAGAAAGLLLISSVNVGCLLFTRSLERRREMVIKASVGASRSRLISELLVETTLLTTLGTVVGVVLGTCSLSVIKNLSPQDLYRFQEVHLGLTALPFVLGLTVLVAVLAGLLPAWSVSGVNLASLPKGQRAGASKSHQQMQSFLVVAQVALAFVLLFGVGLLVCSFQAVANTPTGFNSSRLFSADILLTKRTDTADPNRTRIFFDRLLEETRKIPEISDAALNDRPPFISSNGWASPFWVTGEKEPDPGRAAKVNTYRISPSYFRTLGIPILQGRDFDANDKPDRPKVIIVDQALVDRYFPGVDPLGKQISVPTADWSGIVILTIIGVVPHVRQNTADYSDIPFQEYYPYTQDPAISEELLVRSRADSTHLLAELRKAVATIDPDVAIDKLTTYDHFLAEKFVTRKMGLTVAGSFSGVALFLSVVGIYALLAGYVARQTKEIGVRMALGAKQTNILNWVILRGIKLIGLGIVIGIVSAIGFAHLIAKLLYGVTPLDPITLILTILVLGLSGMMACLIPALRAARINPITALRE